MDTKRTPSLRAFFVSFVSLWRACLRSARTRNNNASFVERPLRYRWQNPLSASPARSASKGLGSRHLRLLSAAGMLALFFPSPAPAVPILHSALRQDVLGCL